MFVRMKVGRYAGDVREVGYMNGVDLVNAGFADRFHFDGRDNPAPSVVVGPSSIDVSAVRNLKHVTPKKRTRAA
jgi:hypothetical protein